MISLLKESINDDLQNIVDRELIRSEAVTNSSKLELDTLSDLEECIQHRHSDVIEFIRYGKQIQKGCCLGHSDKGCITFSGIDLKTGQLLCITEWMIKYSQLDVKCAVSCRRENSDTPCVKHGVDAVIANIENQMMILAQLKHKNLVHYECVQCVKQADGILVYVAQDFVLGNTIDNLSHCLGWCDLSVSMVARSIMEALLFLQSKSITHGLLTDSTVYIDNCSTIRVTNFALAPYIQDLIGESTVMKNDLNALGVLVESLSPTSSTAMRDFINKCSSQDVSLTIELLDHPFLQLKLRNLEIYNSEQEMNELDIIEPTYTVFSPSRTSDSRFKSNYRILEYLGIGTFAEVFKAQNNLDNRIYAIKEICLENNRKLNQITKEVILVSRLNHENIVRYYTSWIETTPLRSIKSNSYSSSTSDDIEFVYSSNDNSEDDEIDTEESDFEDTMLSYLYIQMEYCDSTLRTVIDNQLYADIDRLWRLFREIVEGLAYIHQQGIVHRNLKPENIFIQSQDRIKIGDFPITMDIGTTLYSAPELANINSKFGEHVEYDEKIDMYSLGLILFEMSCPPFINLIERYDVIQKLKSTPITMPNIILNDSRYQVNVKLIQCLLNHNSCERPTAEELLTSELIQCTTNVISTVISPSSSSSSRFKSDYTILEELEPGAFGDVFKVHHNLDNRVYAIKKVRPENNDKLKEITKEVEMISRLHHENVVRYNTSWIESELIDLDNISKNDNDDEESGCEDTMLYYLYIKMEYCEGSTLRNIIDNQLYADIDRLWRMFREILEGLAYIHQQGIMHRDLKPANIFIQSQDRIKIGDFGLATIYHPTVETKVQSISSIKVSTSLTADIGTELYIAPELASENSISGEKVKYDAKVDLYSLGIILFEMSCPHFKTGMERIQVIQKLRTTSITMPNIILDDTKYQLNVKIIQWLLNHNPVNRPTAEQLLASKLLPISESKTNEINEMICNTIAHRETKEYKNLVAQCLQQESSVISDLTYYDVPHSNTFDCVKSKIVNVFRKHGANEFSTPLLTQCSKNYVTNQNTVRVMTESGDNVFLPYDLRLPFARHIAIKGINSMRRYSIGRVYRKDFNYHPKQLYECAFDIVTPNPGSLLVDAELISIAYEIAIKVLPTLKQKNLSIRINHTTLLRAIFMDFNVPPNKYDDIASNLLLYTEGKIVKSRIKQILNIPNPRNSTNLFKVLTTEISLNGGKNSIADLYLKQLIKEPTAAIFARRAIQDIESVVELSRGLGVTCDISLLPGLPGAYERTKCGGIVWQLLAKQKCATQEGRYLLAAGERYDTFLKEFQRAAHNKIVNLPETKIYGAGFSFSLENLMCAYAGLPKGNISNFDWAPVQVLVCVLSTGPPLNEVIDILNSLWSAGICSGFVEATSPKNARDLARKIGARNILIQNENKVFTLRTFVNQNMLQDRQVTRAALINTIKRMIEPDENDLKQKRSAQQRKRLVKVQNKKQTKRISENLSRTKSQ